MYGGLLLLLFFPLPLPLLATQLHFNSFDVNVDVDCAQRRLSQTFLAFVCCAWLLFVRFPTHKHTHRHARPLSNKHTHTNRETERQTERHAHIDTRAATHAIVASRRQFNNFELELEFDCLSLPLSSPFCLHSPSLLLSHSCCAVLSRWHFRNNATCLAAADSLRRCLPLFYLIFYFLCLLLLFMSLVWFSLFFFFISICICVCVCLSLAKAFRLKCRQIFASSIVTLSLSPSLLWDIKLLSILLLLRVRVFVCVCVFVCCNHRLQFTVTSRCNNKPTTTTTTTHSG